MASVFYTILTDRGQSKLSTCIAEGRSLPLASIALGEGLAGAYYDPDGSEVALKSQAWSGAVNSIYRDSAHPTWVIAEAVVPVQDGGFYIREGGIYDTDGELFAIGKLPESYKPGPTTGSSKPMTILFVIEVGAAAQVTLMVDNASVYTTLTRHIADLSAQGASQDAALAAAVATLRGEMLSITELTAAVNQLRNDLVAKSSFVRNLAPNGYQILPDGLIRQWGQAAALSTGNGDVTYPIAFTEAVYDRTAFPQQTSTDNLQRSLSWATDVFVGSLTTTRFLMRKEGSKVTAGNFSYEVIGK